MFWELLALAYEAIARKPLSFQSFRRLANIGIYVLLFFFRFVLFVGYVASFWTVEKCPIK